MFDPHRVGPSTSSYYDRNKGRVIQRKLVDSFKQPITRSELLSYLPIMRLNGIVQTPILQNLYSNDPTFSFEDDTYLAAGSSVTFSGSSSVTHINVMQIVPPTGGGTVHPLSSFSYTSTAKEIKVTNTQQPGYNVFVYISYNSSSGNYSLHTDAKSELPPGTNTYSVPANSLYIVVHDQIFPTSFQLFNVDSQGTIASYIADPTDETNILLNSQFFHFDDDRLATN